MKISARLENSPGRNEITLQTNNSVHTIEIPPRATGPGSSVNGGELLFLAVATCYCNDIYREAAKRGIRVESVEVEVRGEFLEEGEPVPSITYKARVTAHATEDEIRELMQHTDRVAEIQNTLRSSPSVVLISEAVSI